MIGRRPILPRTTCCPGATAPRPGDPAAAWAVLYGVVEQHVGRLRELLAANEAREAAEDPAWAERAALETRPAFERHRHSQSAKRWELLRTLGTLCKMRKSELGSSNEKAATAQEECQMADDECQMAEGELPVAGNEPSENEVASDDRVASGQWSVASEAGESAEPTQGTCLAREKTQNKANLESKKGPETQEFQPETARTEGRKQSQFGTSATELTV